MSGWDIATSILVLVGVAFVMLATIGILRMPDVYTRMQSATKAGTLGVALAAIAAAVHFRTAFITVEVTIIVAILFATAPIASHLIARAAYTRRVAIWKQTVRDDFREECDARGANSTTEHA